MTIKNKSRMPKPRGQTGIRTSNLIRKIWITVFLALGGSLFAAPEVYTVESILVAMREAEAKYENLTIKYKVEKYFPSVSDKALVITEAAYSQALDQGFRLQKFHNRAIDPNNPAKESTEDLSYSFNGKSTFIYEGPSWRNGKGKGFVLKDDQTTRYLSSYNAGPYQLVWYTGGTSKKWTDVIDMNDLGFEIESTSESIEGLPAVILVGHNERIKYKLWICPERSFLPLKQQMWERKKEGLLYDEGLYDLQQLPNGAWFPKVIKVPADSNVIPNPEWVMVQTVLSVSLEPEKDFSLEFPPGTYVIDEVNEVSYRTIDPKQENNK